MADGIVITGPTASGKTALSVDVARRIHGEIISADSRQVYAGMDIGTAKPGLAERDGVPHFGFDLIQPGERYSAGRFAADARRWISQIAARAHTPILVGGTGFFLRALTHPLFHEPHVDPRRKELLKQYLSSFSREELLRWVQCLDEVNAGRLASEGGRQRLARVIEIALLTGRPLSAWHAQQQPEEPLQLMIFVLELPRTLLFERVDRRVDAMLQAGLVEEVRRLLDAGFDEHTTGLDATGYREIISYLRGDCTLETAADAIKTATRQYARRQQTWFRHQLPEDAIVLDGTLEQSALVQTIVNRWHENRD